MSDTPEANPLKTITVLGCGATYGVPLAGGVWGLCDPANPKNERTRPSVLVTQNEQCLLIDIGPDFRLQTSRANVIPDTILITHGHWDHIAGIGELPYYMEEVLKGDLNVYTDETCMAFIRGMFPYLFFGEKIDGSTSIVGFGEHNQYKIFWHPIRAYEAFEANGMKILPFSQHHGGSDSLGIRIADFVYSPDVKSFPIQSWNCLADIDTWILDCDYWEPSESHGDPETVLKLVYQFKPRQVFLTHMDEKMDYLVLKSWFVDRGYGHVTPAYDGQMIELRRA
ncbi:MBL fold metallo-hydrolase [Stappia sp. BW2]|uniref:MBL fold metallo-hydrolase n=1 Tax=Stappia sp. BW2 TaxID=2592622 RepID=UPI0011DEF458|nr:MBL fold metallo-hydrolase [Stappia sp. BW2]TYC68282.1 MBL fold metallo-hydrolase [Stappia sp. BW2]